MSSKAQGSSSKIGTHRFWQLFDKRSGEMTAENSTG